MSEDTHEAREVTLSAWSALLASSTSGQLVLVPNTRGKSVFPEMYRRYLLERESAAMQKHKLVKCEITVCEGKTEVNSESPSHL